MHDNIWKEIAHVLFLDDSAKADVDAAGSEDEDEIERIIQETKRIKEVLPSETDIAQNMTILPKRPAETSK